MPRIKVIVNPNAGRGYAGRVSPDIDRAFHELEADFELVHTQGRGHAIDLASEAVDAGFDTIVAVGGDGTSHEVMNGIMARSNGHPAATMGAIPAGSGNDFAAMKGAPTDIPAACALINTGHSQMIDVGSVVIDGKVERYFDNAVGIGFDGHVTIGCLRHKRLRGMALYLPVVLRTVFVDMTPPKVTIDIDGRTFEQTTLMTVISNGQREGGSFMVAPEALCDDGQLDVVMVESMPNLQVLGMIPRFMAGTHTKDPRVQIERGAKITVRSEEPLFYHVDGEILSDPAHVIEAQVLHRQLSVIAPADGFPIVTVGQTA